GAGRPRLYVREIENSDTVQRLTHGNSKGPLFVHGLIFGTGGVFTWIDPDIDDRRLAQLVHRFARTLQRRRYLRGIPHLFAVAAEHLGKFAEWNIAQQVSHITALLAVFRQLAVANLIHGGVVADHGDIRHSEAVGGLHVECRHSEGSVAVIA